jgi:hypothetical protein
MKIIKTKEHMEGGDDQGESDDEDEDEERNRLSDNGIKKRPDPVSELVTWSTQTLWYDGISI